MSGIIAGIEKVNEWVGKTVSFLSIILVLVIITDVLLRYFFNYTSAASFELEWHLFAALFLLSAGWTLQQDRHVRVDLFYQRFSAKGKAFVNLIGTLFLLLPFCVIGFWESLPFVKNSFMVNEMSPDPGGLPARYIIKSTIPGAFFLIGLQAVAIVLKSSLILTGKSDVAE